MAKQPKEAEEIELTPTEEKAANASLSSMGQDYLQGWAARHKGKKRDEKQSTRWLTGWDECNAEMKG